ncbi:mobile element protein [Vibrio astriarenae]|nr:mobile element protein [Vibrio sp. C7]
MANPEFKWKHFAPEIILWCSRWYGSTPVACGFIRSRSDAKETTSSPSG